MLLEFLALALKYVSSLFRLFYQKKHSSSDTARELLRLSNHVEQLQKKSANSGEGNRKGLTRTSSASTDGFSDLYIDPGDTPL